MTIFRVAHDVEYQKVWRSYVPEVFIFKLGVEETNPVKLTKAWQQRIMELNPGMTGAGFRSLFKYDRAFTNYTGFDMPGHPRADFINRLNLTAPLPLLDKPRICGGAIIHGTLSGDTITVEVLNGNLPPPSLSYILARPWLYFKAVIVRSDGTTFDFPQNPGHPVYIPLVANHTITVKYNTKIYGKPYPYITRV